MKNQYGELSTKQGQKKLAPRADTLRVQRQGLRGLGTLNIGKVGFLGDATPIIPTRCYYVDVADSSFKPCDHTDGR